MKGNEELFEDLVKVIEKLRSEDGCPWDKAQTISSVRENILEEALEVIDAIEQNDMEHIKEELGDLLFLIFFVIQMAKESGFFTYNDVLKGAIDKLIYRHPHVFGEKEAKDEREAIYIWKEQKRKANKRKEITPKRLPFYSIMLKLKDILPSLKEEKFDLVVGIKRGGLIPASILAYKLNLPLDFLEIKLYEDGPMPKKIYEKPKIVSIPVKEIIKNKRILLVDDIENTGETINKAKELLLDASYIKTFAIIGKHTDYRLFLKEDCKRLPWF